MTSRMANIKAAVSRNYGPETVTFELAVQADVSGYVAVNLEYEKLMSMLYRQHEDYAARWLPKAPQPQAAPTAPNPDGVWIKCDEMVLETKQGKDYYAIKGGLYNLHGVRIWKEVMEEYELVFKPDDKGVMKMYNKEMLVIDVDGKKKVDKIRVKV